MFRSNFLKAIFTRRYFWFFALCLITMAALSSGSLMSVMEFTTTDLPPHVSKEFGRSIRVAVNRKAVLPLVFMTLPMIGVIILVISPFELNIGAYGTLIVSILYWQPCIYPLLSLYFVRPLRDELRRKTRRTKVTFVSSKSQLVR
uniref:Aa_trans domain-containing protein n=1 Tax=Ascaris lumbricoides TaxID=6252 RepID=A0A0M3ITF3_ASCLU